MCDLLPQPLNPFFGEYVKLSDYGKLIKLLDEFEIPYTEYTDPDFIDDESVKAGAILTVCIRDSVNVNFDMNYDCISSSTDSIGSVVFRNLESEE